MVQFKVLRSLLSFLATVFHRDRRPKTITKKKKKKIVVQNKTDIDTVLISEQQMFKEFMEAVQNVNFSDKDIDIRKLRFLQMTMDTIKTMEEMKHLYLEIMELLSTCATLKENHLSPEEYEVHNETNKLFLQQWYDEVEKELDNSITRFHDTLVNKGWTITERKRKALDKVSRESLAGRAVVRDNPTHAFEMIVPIVKTIRANFIFIEALAEVYRREDI